MVTMTTVSFYMITAYTPTFGSSELHLTSMNSLIVTLCVGASKSFLAANHGFAFRSHRSPSASVRLYSFDADNCLSSDALANSPNRPSPDS